MFTYKSSRLVELIATWAMDENNLFARSARTFAVELCKMQRYAVGAPRSNRHVAEPET